MRLTAKQSELFNKLRESFEGRGPSFLNVSEWTKRLGWPRTTFNNSLTALFEALVIEKIESRPGRGGGLIVRMPPETVQTVPRLYQPQGNPPPQQELQPVEQGTGQLKPDSSPAYEKRGPSGGGPPSRSAGADSSRTLSDAEPRTLSDAEIAALEKEEQEHLIERGVGFLKRRKEHKANHLRYRQAKRELERDRRRIEGRPPEELEQGWLAGIDPPANDECLALLDVLTSQYGTPRTPSVQVVPAHDAATFTPKQLQDDDMPVGEGSSLFGEGAGG